MTFQAPPYIERLVPYVPGKPVEELERELGITGAVKLASNENPFGPSPKVTEALAAMTPELARYPDAAAYAFRRDLARHHDVEPDLIVTGNGSNDLIDLLCRVALAPDDHAVIGDPSFVCYRLGLTAVNAKFTEVPLRDRVAWNVDDLLAAVTPATRLLFLANPNNPTGAHVGAKDLEKLVRSLPERVLLAVDEAYVEFADAADFVSALTMRELRENLLVLRTFSKAYGLASLRAGYAIGPRDIIDYLNRLRPPFNCNSLAQVAARTALTDQAHVQRYVEVNRRERARVTAGLTKLGYKVAPSQANFVLFEAKEPAKALYDRLLRRGVIVRPMPPPIADCIRLTIGKPEENDRLLRSVEEVGAK